MAEVDSRKNGTAGLPEGWQDWPTLTQSAKLLRISKERFSEYVKLGVIKKYPAPNSRGSALGSYRFNPTDLDELEERLEDEEVERREEPLVSPTTADTVRASNEGMKMAQEHAQRLVSLFEDNFKFVMAAIREENAALRADNALLRLERKDLEQMREEVRATKSVEALAMAELKSEADTKAQAIEIAKPIVKHFINAALVKGGVDPRLLALKEAVEAIPKGTFGALFDSGILPDEVVAKLKVGLAWEEPAARDTVPAPEQAAT